MVKIHDGDAAASSRNTRPDSGVVSRKKRKQTELVGSVSSSSKGTRQDKDAKKSSKMNENGPSSQAPELTEKRLARFVARPSVVVTDRIERAFQHRLYLIDAKLGGDRKCPTCEFFVLGSTGNVYTVNLEHLPSCTCPDFPWSKKCKHLLFVMLRVLELPPDDPRVWQNALISSELKELFRCKVDGDGVLASQTVRQRFLEIMGGANSDLQEDLRNIQRDISGDCPICYESMATSKVGNEHVVFCKTCGNNVHSDCFQRWSKSKRSSGEKVTCIYCRALWSNEVNRTVHTSRGYINLVNYSEGHRAGKSIQP